MLALVGVGAAAAGLGVAVLIPAGAAGGSTLRAASDREVGSGVGGRTGAGAVFSATTAGGAAFARSAAGFGGSVGFWATVGFGGSSEGAVRQVVCSVITWTDRARRLPSCRS